MDGLGLGAHHHSLLVSVTSLNRRSALQLSLCPLRMTWPLYLSALSILIPLSVSSIRSIPPSTKQRISISQASRSRYWIFRSKSRVIIVPHHLISSSICSGSSDREGSSIYFR
ncbi:hypothetical protein SISSUDRAFT_523015 [Sistotremastrum suecicum HHB10207 ss-3]|uniref:Uncharacterized protein n=1 Tax=Sistotremastrum suecicum HHB10207 ss-3 TaxID=1314776 RepID=A0A165XWP2_9AGAM|nr:hypothetical protein SISSUDRAFT_523015 [Sistotremastrum suecicum HHB10207 ss-3]